MSDTNINEDFFKKLLPIASNKKYLFKPVKTEELAILMNEYDISLEEATLFAVILNELLTSGSSLQLLDILGEGRDIEAGSSDYIRLAKSLKNLEKRDLVTLSKGYRGSNTLNPTIEVDDRVFEKLILGINSDVSIDYSDVYSIIEALDELINKRSNEKINTRRLFADAGKIIDKIDKKLPFYAIIKRYCLAEQLMISKACANAFQGKKYESISGFAKEVFEGMRDIARFTSDFYSDKLRSFKDGVLEIDDDDDSFISDSYYVISKEAYCKIFQIDKKTKTSNEIQTKLCTYLKSSSFKQELFLDETISNTINTITKAISKKEYPRVVKRLQSINLPTGIITLLYGYPGTGKTATVYEISKLTKRDVMQVDISSIRDKWVGGSEKNLKEIFREYAKAKKELRSTPILLFNEADALFGRRVNAQNSVDVMNNSMQNILLEELERFEGIFFATTNLMDNMDDAFSRRFLYKVEFSKPSAKTREKIWGSKNLALSQENCKILSQYDLSGGQIENITRKFMLDSILNCKDFDIEVLKNLCFEESSFKQENSRPIGF